MGTSNKCEHPTFFLLIHLELCSTILRTALSWSIKLNNANWCLLLFKHTDLGIVSGRPEKGVRFVGRAIGNKLGKNLLVSPLLFYSSPLTKILKQDRYNLLDDLAYISSGRLLIARIFPSPVLCHFLVLWLLVFEILPTTLNENHKSSGQKRNTKQTKSLDLLKS